MNSETNEPSNYSSKSKSLSLGRQGQLSVQVWLRVPGVGTEKHKQYPVFVFVVMTWRVEFTKES